MERKMEEAQRRVVRLSGRDPALCYACGKCTAGCPMAFAMDLMPHQVMRLAARGRVDRLLAARTLWACVSCETCSARCPQQMPVSETLDALRQTALEAGVRPADKRVAAFHRHFLAQVRKHGRVNEFPLVMRYKLSTGAFLADALTSPAMCLKGKLRLLPRNSSPQAQRVRRIFERCSRD